MPYALSDIKKLGTIVGIWAHPDDETCWMGGLMALARRNGQRVIIITATRGDGGETADESRWPKQSLGMIREQELRTALQLQGVEEIQILGYKDGSLITVDANEAVNNICTLLEGVAVDSIFSFGADGVTGHNDHKTVHLWSKQVAERLGVSGSFYNAVETTERYEQCGKACDEVFAMYFATEKPIIVAAQQADLYFEFDSNIAELKLRALSAHGSQYARFFENVEGRAYLEALASHEAFTCMKVS